MKYEQKHKNAMMKSGPELHIPNEMMKFIREMSRKFVVKISTRNEAGVDLVWRFAGDKEPVCEVYPEKNFWGTFEVMAIQLDGYVEEAG